VTYVSFPWPPLEAALSIFNFTFLLKQFLEGINKTKEIAINVES
jgi:hypothetical protein